MKKLLSLALACAMTLSLAACGSSSSPGGQASSGGQTPSNSAGTPNSSAGTSASEVKTPNVEDYLSGDYTKLPADGPTVNLTLGHAMQEATDSHKMLLELKAALEKYSDGKITMTIYPNGQMGSDNEMIASCLAGDIDLVYQSGATHATFVPETNIFDTPFLLAGYESAKIEEVLTNSEFRDIYNAANEEGGLVCLMLRASGATYLTANKSVTSMVDLSGLKVRTAQSEARMAVWRSLGANPTPMSFNELYMALQNGTVEAQDNMLSNIVNSALFEVQDYLIPTKMATPAFDLTMNKDTFYALPAEYQALLWEICEDLTSYDYALSNAMEDVYYNQLLGECGMTACEVSSEFLADMVEAVAPAIESAKQGVGNDALYDALDKLLNA